MNYQLINSSTNFDVVVLADGDYPQHAIPTQILQQAPRIVCCDSAIELLHPSLYNKVEAVVGDGDSMSDAAKLQFHDVLHVEHEQADNDVTLFANLRCAACHGHRLRHVCALPWRLHLRVVC